jgi:hypothetical protein
VRWHRGAFGGEKAFYPEPMLLAGLKFEIETDWLDALDVLFGLAGSVVGVVAILIALDAKRTADRTVADERRRVFELEILRELMKEIGDPDTLRRLFSKPARLHAYDLQRSMLSSELSYWKNYAGLPDARAVIRATTMGVEWQSLDDELRENEKEFTRLRNVTLEADQRKWNAEDLGARDLDAEEVSAKAENLMVELQKARQEIDKEHSDVERRAFVEFSERLTRDLTEAAQSQVEAGQQPRLSLWRRWWWYRV